MNRAKGAVDRAKGAVERAKGAVERPKGELDRAKGEVKRLRGAVRVTKERDGTTRVEVDRPTGGGDAPPIVDGIPGSVRVGRL